MDFTIYTFGDVEIFRAALAGVAMIFSPSQGFLVSDQGMGLGALAGLGLLMGLVTMLLNGIMRQKVELGEFIMVIILFAVLFVPTFDVNIEDYNGAGIAKVDNVPLGVAMPASLTSAIARELNIRMGTAFSTVDGYPSGLMTPQALTSPLKLLYSLRYAPDFVTRNTDQLAQRLARNVPNLIAYCLAGRQTFKGDWETAPITTALEATVVAAGKQSGLTLFQAPGAIDPSLVLCSDASTSISADIAMWSAGAAGSPLQKTLSAAAAKDLAAPINIVAGKAQVQPIQPEDIQSALAMIDEATSVLATQYVTTTIWGTFVSEAFRCAEGSGNPEDWGRCSPLVSAATQYNESGAAGGTFFQRLMFHGMNLLFFVWICLSPVVAVMMLMLGIRGIKLAGGYLLFGAWSVSWYVGASIINFYVLKQVQYSLSMLGGFEGLTPVTIAEWNNVLQTELGVAGDLMASTPLIMMALMTGSVYGMTQLASRFGGREHYDEKVNSPSIEGSAAFNGRTSSSDRAHLGITGANRNLGSGPAFEVQATDRIAQEQSVSASREASQAYSSTLGQAVDRAYSAGSTRQDRDDFSTSLKASGQTTRAVAADALSETSESKAMNEAQRTEVGNALKGMVSGEVSWDSGKAVLGKVAGAFSGLSGRVALGTSYEDSVNKLESLGYTHDTARRMADTFRDTKTTQANLADETSHANVKAFSKNYGKTDSVKKDASLSAALSTTERAVENASTAQSKAQTSSWTNRVSPEQMVQRVHDIPGANNQLQFAHQQHFSNDEQYRADYKTGQRLYQGLTNPVARDMAAQLHALERSDIRDRGNGDGITPRFQDIASAAGLTMGEPMHGPQSDLRPDSLGSLRANANMATAGARSFTPDGLPDPNKLIADVDSRQHPGGNNQDVHHADTKYQANAQAAKDAQPQHEFKPTPTKTLDPGLLAKPASALKDGITWAGKTISGDKGDKK